MEVYTYIGICIFGVTLPPQSAVASAQFEYNLSKTKLLFRVDVAIRSLLNETSTPRSRGFLQALYTSTLVWEFFFAIRTVWSLLQNLSIIS